MACKIERPDPQVLFDQLRDAFSVHVLGGAPVIPESNEWYVVSNDYAAAEMFYAYADQLARETDPATACCENLTAMAARQGVFPYPASFASGYVRLTGTPGAPLPNRIEVSTTLGNFVSVGIIPAELDGTGHATIQIQSLIPGPAFNSAGVITEGTLVNPIADVERTVEICGGQICGGEAPETCESFRLRYIDRIAYQPRATAAWLRSKLMEYPCVTRVLDRAWNCCECNDSDEQCDACETCGTKLEFYVMFDNAFPCGIAPGNIVQDVSTWVFGEVPGGGQGQVEIGVCGRVVPVTGVPIDLRVTVAGCPTGSQLRKAEQNLFNLFMNVSPSQPISMPQLEFEVYAAVGSDKDIEVSIDIPGGEPDRAVLGITDCCGINPLCDYVACLGTVTFTNTSSDQSSCT